MATNWDHERINKKKAVAKTLNNCKIQEHINQTVKQNIACIIDDLEVYFQWQSMRQFLEFDFIQTTR